MGCMDVDTWRPKDMWIYGVEMNEGEAKFLVQILRILCLSPQENIKYNKNAPEKKKCFAKTF